MSETTGFAFHSGKSFVHNLDIRFKLICLMILSLACLKTGFTGLCLLTPVLIAILLKIPISIISFLKEVRYFFLLLFFVFIARSISVPGTPYVEFMNISRTLLLEGIPWQMTPIIIRIGKRLLTMPI